MTVVEQAVAAMEEAKQEILKLRQENINLRAALKSCHLQMLQSNNDSEYAQEAHVMAIAAMEEK